MDFYLKGYLKLYLTPVLLILNIDGHACLYDHHSTLVFPHICILLSLHCKRMCSCFSWLTLYLPSLSQPNFFLVSFIFPFPLVPSPQSATPLKNHLFLSNIPSALLVTQILVLYLVFTSLLNFSKADMWHEFYR